MIGGRTPRGGPHWLICVTLGVVLLLAPACGSTTTGAGAPTVPTAVAASSAPSRTAPSSTATSGTTTTSTTKSTTTTTSTTTATTSTTTTSTTTASITTSSVAAAAPPTFDALQAAVGELEDGNIAASVSVWRDGRSLFGWAAGTRSDGGAVNSDTPFVIASVSKLVTALTVARLAQLDELSTTDRVPWDEMRVAHHPGWDDVTVRELLAHTSGLPVNRKTWLDDPGSCRIPLEAALAEPPTAERGTWRYSNGNFCALGLLVEAASGQTIDRAAGELVFEPSGVTGPYLATEGLHPTSVAYSRGVTRLERLGGAGLWIASTDDVAAMLTTVTETDREVLEWPGIIVDQYGWGHTGTIDGAKACAWVLDEGATVIVAIVSGQRPSTGGAICDLVVPALAIDLGVWAGEPLRNPV